MHNENEKKCARCNKPKKEWQGRGVKVGEDEYCCLGCAGDTGCTCDHNEYDFDNNDTNGTADQVD